ncbi:MAG: molybdopterin-guanine dinucleotide biosynthesis protein B [Planctomycetota bacterium]
MDRAEPPSSRRHRPPVVSFVGRSKTGKTLFLERLIPLLKARGLAVGTIKHHAHEIEVDKPGKDTHRHLVSGADRVALTGPKQAALFERVEDELRPGEIVERFFPDKDVVLTEGFKGGPFPKIEVARRALSEDLTCRVEDGLIAVIADFDPAVPVPRFSFEDAGEVADFLEASLMNDPGDAAWSVTLQVDGKSVPIKAFVRDVFVRVSLGLVETLKGVPDDPSSVEIVLKRGS